MRTMALHLGMLYWLMPAACFADLDELVDLDATYRVGTTTDEGAKDDKCVQQQLDRLRCWEFGFGGFASAHKKWVLSSFRCHQARPRHSLQHRRGRGNDTMEWFGSISAVLVPFLNPVWSSCTLAYTAQRIH